MHCSVVAVVEGELKFHKYKKINHCNRHSQIQEMKRIKHELLLTPSSLLETVRPVFGGRAMFQFLRWKEFLLLSLTNNRLHEFSKTQWFHFCDSGAWTFSWLSSTLKNLRIYD